MFQQPNLIGQQMNTTAPLAFLPPLQRARASGPVIVTGKHFLFLSFLLLLKIVSVGLLAYV